jgi:hypothetical protein
MNTSAREDRIGELLRHLARGGHTEKEVGRIERDIAELRASESREQEWRSLTQAPVQPVFRNLDSF